MIPVSWLKGCDFSYSKPDLPQLWAAGYRVILIYLSDSSKGFTNAYAKQALDLGFKILPLYETSAGAALGGFATGAAHAKFATAKAAAQGVPPEIPIIYALDQDFTMTELMGPVRRYVEGLDSVAGEDSLYGGYNQLGYLIQAGVAHSKQNFQTYAWSAGKWLSTDVAPIEQFHNGVNVAGGQVDDCRVLDSLTFWEKDMPLSAADIAAVAKAVWDIDYIPVTPTDVNNPTWVAKNALAYAINHTVSAESAAKAAAAKPNAPSAADIAAAVVAALPDGPDGTLTPEDVQAAVHAALAKLSLSLAP